jgi:hypothetical protein
MSPSAVSDHPPTSRDGEGPAAAAQPPELPELVGGVTHSPFELHTSGATQSATDAQLVLHAPVPGSQMYGAHSVVPASPAPPVVFIEVWGPEHTAPPFGVQSPWLQP